MKRGKPEPNSIRYVLRHSVYGTLAMFTDLGEATTALRKIVEWLEASCPLYKAHDFYLWKEEMFIPGKINFGHEKK